MLSATSQIVERHQNQRGFSLVELMISMVIGLVLAITASTIYLYSKQSFNSSTEASQMEENGKFALNLLTKSIQSAGFVMIDPAIPSPQGPIDNKITGCDFGMVNPITPVSGADLACLAATPAGARRSASIAVFTETDAYSGTGAKYQGFDCVGEGSIAVPTTTGTVNETRSYFFVAQTTVATTSGSTTMGQLSCVADHTPAGGPAAYQAQPLIPGIEQIAFNYLRPSAADPNTAQASTTAAALTAAQWPTVLAVDICVLAKSVQPGASDTNTAYTDCYGGAIVAAAGDIYRTFRTTVRLRNKSSI
jgi:type IV pilus assembly protein PilW